MIEEAKPDKIITIGWNCIVLQASFDYLHGLYENVGIIWTDVHPDVSTVKDGCPNAHTMALGLLMGYEESSLSDLMKRYAYAPRDNLIRVNTREKYA